MNCEDCREELSQYLDNELTAAERTALDGHLADCPQCAAELERLQAVTAALKETPTPPMSAAAVARLDEAVADALGKRQAAASPSDPDRARKAWWHRLAQPSFAGLAVSLGVLAVVVTVWSSQSTDTFKSASDGAIENEAAVNPESRVPGTRSVKPRSAPGADGAAAYDDEDKDPATLGDSLSAPAEEAAPQIFSADDLDELVLADHDDAARVDIIPAEPVGSGLSAMDAAVLTAGERDGDLLFAQWGEFTEPAGKQDAWIVVIEFTDDPGNPVAAAVNRIGRVIYRTIDQPTP